MVVAKHDHYTDSPAPPTWLWAGPRGTVGPLPAKTVASMLAKGEIKLQDRLSKDGGLHWIPAGICFPAAASPIPDPLPPLTSPPASVPVNPAAVRPYGNDFLLGWEAISSGRLFRNPVILFFAMAALSPMVAGMFSGSSTRGYFIFWGVYFCAMWAFGAGAIIKPRRRVLQEGLAYGLFTAVVGMTFLLWLQNSIPGIAALHGVIGAHELGNDQGIVRYALAFVVGVGVPEEAIKLLPLLIFARGSRFSASEFVFLGMMSGFGFAIAENLDYATDIVIGNALAAAGKSADLEGFLANIHALYGSLVTGQLLRLISLPILHSAWTGYAGWFVGRAVARRGDGWPGVAAALGVAAVLHGLYNTACLYPHWNILFAAASLALLGAYLVQGISGGKSRLSAGEATRNQSS